MSVEMTSKTTVVLRGDEITVTIEAPGSMDDLCAMQDGAELILRWLHEVLPSLAVGAIPLEVQDYIMNAVVKGECASESAARSSEN